MAILRILSGVMFLGASGKKGAEASREPARGK
jgi:hypothetical protein